jgi:hypothetical protein
MRSDEIGQYCETSGWNWAGINSLRTGCGLVDCDTTQTYGQPRTFRRNRLLPSSGWRLHKIQNKTETYEAILTFHQLFITRERYRLIVFKNSDKNIDMEHKGTQRASCVNLGQCYCKRAIWLSTTQTELKVNVTSWQHRRNVKRLTNSDYHKLNDRIIPKHILPFFKHMT